MTNSAVGKVHEEEHLVSLFYFFALVYEYYPVSGGLYNDVLRICLLCMTSALEHGGKDQKLVGYLFLSPFWGNGAAVPMRTTKRFRSPEQSNHIQHTSDPHLMHAWYTVAVVCM